MCRPPSRSFPPLLATPISEPSSWLTSPCRRPRRRTLPLSFSKLFETTRAHRPAPQRAIRAELCNRRTRPVVPHRFSGRSGRSRAGSSSGRTRFDHPSCAAICRSRFQREYSDFQRPPVRRAPGRGKLPGAGPESVSSRSAKPHHPRRSERLAQCQFRITSAYR